MGSASAFELFHSGLRRPLGWWARVIVGQERSAPRCGETLPMLPAALACRSSRRTSPSAVMAAGEAEPSLARAA